MKGRGSLVPPDKGKTYAPEVRPRSAAAQLSARSVNESAVMD